MNLSLETERLSLRPMTQDDFDFIIELETRPESQKYESEDIPTQENLLEDCQWYVEKAKLLPGCGAVRYIVATEHDEKIGSVLVRCNWEKTREWEIGYSFLSEYWGQGYATEATKKVIEFAFRELSVHKLMAFVNCANKGSVGVARRAGMVQEGHMREARLIDGKWYDEFVFTLLKRDLE